jgi:dihydropteroate synthase
VAASILGGAHIVRVHDVPEMAQVARVSDFILGVPGKVRR